MEEHQIPVLRILGSSPSRVVFFRFIKKLLKLPKRTNSERMKLALGIPDLCTYLISRLLKLKIKYENVFHEKLNIYDKVIEKTIGKIKGDILYNSLKNIGNNFEY